MPSNKPKHLLDGRNAEDHAEAYLLHQGLRTLKRNYRCKPGEIDLIMEDGSALVFVEVRLRSNPSFGSAAESVTIPKQRRIIKAAQHFLVTSGMDRPCRFDILGLDGNGKFTWLQNAFET